MLRNEYPNMAKQKKLKTFKVPNISTFKVPNIEHSTRY